LLDGLGLHTVCESAKCPNHWECWSKGTATFMIAGDRCTRACGFCAVSTAKPLALEQDEPQRVAEATRRMGLKHVVITAVARDDLQDGGAEHFRKTIEAVRSLNPGIVVEVLTPDFLDRDDAIDSVLAARPEIFNHNLETVRRLTPSVRHRATYDRSLRVLAKVKDRLGDAVHTKSGMMLGLGETQDEVLESPSGFPLRHPHFGTVFAAHPQTPTGGGLHSAVRLRHTPTRRRSHGIHPCGLGPAGAQFVPCR